MNVKAGDVVYAQERDGGVFLAPATERDLVLEGARQALEDLHNGRVSPEFSSVREFVSYMKSKGAKSHR